MFAMFGADQNATGSEAVRATTMTSTTIHAARPERVSRARDTAARGRSMVCVVSVVIGPAPTRPRDA
jgi:hypothetical protein